ncbi:uncharacterized protein AMSG_05764 [Thecamonas trahens ATCC 50062]|uniref:Uncharacterized protein n=1 Tax=Thecamonas trahens ATCC 50062 TaxID=461836 RepID=A0A0L0DFC0_THETB|nr:hypothetical protein AMSG_05764 [Thecamonas trahens ATCC 50062]KNC50008.1 hypothetical protein AMSG_05764 [Thecamonas trahens ATCC 50062]|eukprot:XP_013757175.1 hypothetical protein AMSG_05764 [Thecamonas trahens ATCC 50062]
MYTHMSPPAKSGCRADLYDVAPIFCVSCERYMDRKAFLPIKITDKVDQPRICKPCLKNGPSWRTGPEIADAVARLCDNLLPRALKDTNVVVANIAGTGIAQQSSFYGDTDQYPAGNALSRSSAYSSTAAMPNSSWLLGFSSPVFFHRITLVNRSRCKDRLRDITVSISTADGKQVWKSEVLNPGNELGSPDHIVVPVTSACAIGTVLVVSRAPDPDLIGCASENGNDDDRFVLSLRQVIVNAVEPAQLFAKARAIARDEGLARNGSSVDLGLIENLASGSSPLAALAKLVELAHLPPSQMELASPELRREAEAALAGEDSFAKVLSPFKARMTALASELKERETRLACLDAAIEDRLADVWLADSAIIDVSFVDRSGAVVATLAIPASETFTSLYTLYFGHMAPETRGWAEYADAGRGVQLSSYPMLLAVPPQPSGRCLLHSAATASEKGKDESAANERVPLQWDSALATLFPHHVARLGIEFVHLDVDDENAFCVVACRRASPLPSSL